MIERSQKPFLTVETGEAYQPIRLTYQVVDADQLIETLNGFACLKKTISANTWNWYWRDECADLHFESIESFKKNPEHPLRLGTLTFRDNTLYFSLPSFKRACLAVPLFHRLIHSSIAVIEHADFINKVFGVDERLPRGFAEIFQDTELEKIVEQRVHDYEAIQKRCESADSVEEAVNILSDYVNSEGSKHLPYAERYTFEHTQEPEDPDVVFLGFYIFLRGRELVAIRRWFGDLDYTVEDAAEETMEGVFGGMDIDIIE